MITTIGKAYEYKGGVVIKTERPPTDNLSDDVTIVWHDNRLISPEQRRKAFAIIGEIMAWVGTSGSWEREKLHEQKKLDFLHSHIDDLTLDAIKHFSLRDCTMDVARMYITYLIDFVIINDIPTKEMTAELCDDIEAYVYQCLLHKRCAVCRKPADLHHVDRVGMGRNRDDIVHVGMDALPLCRLHHQEAHQHGDKALLDTYHLVPITIDQKIAKKLKLKAEAKR